MTKRKVSSGDADPAKEPQAADVKEQDDAEVFGPGPIDNNPLQFLIAPMELSTFTSDVWEKRPLHVPADEARKKFFNGLFSFDALAKMSDALEAGAMLLMDQDPGAKGDALSLEDDVDDQMVRAIGPLVFGRDVVAVRYIDGERQTLAGDIADSDTLRALHEEAGATLQLHQPQRFVNGLWRLVAALEAQVGCLVGCNAYMTPRNGQGLAPHHDDVELFVCQTQGSKRWRLYKPVDGFELPSKCSGDLPQEGLGEPTLEVTLQPGDVLYVPRGTVHQAVAQEEGSCHLTISTYQRWTWGDLAGKLLESSADLPLELRKGLPLGLVFKHGIQAELLSADPAAAAEAARPDAATLAAGLRVLADQLIKGPTELLAPAVDNLSLDFLIHRMPPHPCQLPDQGEEPGLEDSLVCRGKNLFRIVPYEPSDDEEDEDEDEEGEEESDEEDVKKKPMIRLVTCLNNSRFTHMISTGGDDDEDDDDDEHDHDHRLCGHPGHDQGGSQSEGDEEMVEADEGEEEENEEEEKGKEGKKAAKKKAEAVEGEEQDASKPKRKKGEKTEEGKEDDKEEAGEEAEIVDLDDEDGEEDDDDDEVHDEDEEEEEPQLQGPIFPAIYAPALAEVLSATEGKPLPVRKLKVPGGGEPEEQLRLALILHEAGFVVTVPGAKKEVKETPPQKKAGKAGGKEEGIKKEGSEERKKATGRGKAVEGAGAGAATMEEEAGASPPAKKAKKGGK